jgi:APA family basic amino acid/polyamine antiporter
MPDLRRELTPWDGIALVVGITMGVGIFAVPGRVAAYLPSVPAVAAAWMLAALSAILGGMIYAELGSRFPKTGGEYIYLQQAFGPGVSFVYGWAQLLVIRSIPAAALSLATAEYVAYFIPMDANERILFAVAVLAALGTANFFGLKSGSTVQMATMLAKVGGCLIFIAAGALLVREYGPNLASVHEPTRSLGPVGSFASVMLLTIFTFTGWDRVGFLAGEMKNPVRDIPRALFFGIGALTIIYFTMNIYYHSILSMEEISGSLRAASDAAERILGPAGGALIAITVAISATGSTNGTIMSCSRIYYAMARDGLFFQSLAKVHPRYNSPHVAILAHCGWAVVLLLFGRNLETFISSLVFVVLISYALMTIALIKARKRGAGEQNCYRMPAYPLPAILYLLIIAAMTITTCYFQPVAAGLNLTLVATGIPFYFIWKRRRIAPDNS